MQNEKKFLVIDNSKRSLYFCAEYTKLGLSCLFDKTSQPFFSTIFRLLLILPVVLVCFYTTLRKTLRIVYIYQKDKVITTFSINSNNEIANLYFNNYKKSINALKQFINFADIFLSTLREKFVFARVMKNSTIEKFIMKRGFYLDNDYIKYIVVVDKFRIFRYSYYSNLPPSKYRYVTLRKWIFKN